MGKKGNYGVKRLIKEVPSTGQVMGTTVTVMEAAVKAFIEKLVDRTIEVAKADGAKVLEHKHTLTAMRQHTQYDFLLDQKLPDAPKRRRRAPRVEKPPLRNQDAPHLHLPGALSSTNMDRIKEEVVTAPSGYELPQRIFDSKEHKEQVEVDFDVNFDVDGA